jgi:ribose transport system permease protein
MRDPIGGNHYSESNLSVTFKDYIRYNGKFAGIAAVTIAFFIISNLLFHTRLESMLQIASFVGVVAAGQTMVFLLAGIDLSVSSVMTLASIETSTLFAAGVMPAPAVFTVTLLTGAMIGFINGVCIVKINVPPLVMTLAMQSMIQGIIMVTTNGIPANGNSDALEDFINQGRIGGLTGSVFIWIGVGVLVTWLLTKTVFGRGIYMLGTNPQVAKLSGVNTGAITIGVYMLCSIFAALAGIMLLGYTGATSTQLGNSYLLPCIAAVLLGGVSPLGGKGMYLGTMFGAFLLCNLEGVLTVMKVTDAMRTVFEGVLILFFVIIYNAQIQNRRRRYPKNKLSAV